MYCIGCCLNSPYGCCQDNINPARGPGFEGCSCEYSPYGNYSAFLIARFDHLLINKMFVRLLPE